MDVNREVKFKKKKNDGVRVGWGSGGSDQGLRWGRWG